MDVGESRTLPFIPKEEEEVPWPLVTERGKCDVVAVNDCLFFIIGLSVVVDIPTVAPRSRSINDDLRLSLLLDVDEDDEGNPRLKGTPRVKDVVLVHVTIK